ncbi:MAG: Thiol-disulfide oxidoreductase ResA [bacterium ADurb.Bin157]|nr:MAG: Thiol-disulfide oxidoreductase ResA [bacterium ADurb.Bin157]
MNIKHIFLLLLAILSFLLVNVFVPKANEPGSISSFEGVILSNMSGHQFRLAGQFAEKPVLFVFWSVTCGTCIEEIPFITSLHKELHDKLTVIGIHPAGYPMKQIKRFLHKHKPAIPYTLAIDSQQTLTKTYNISVLPRLILVNRRGEVLYDHLGYAAENEGAVRSAILSHL